MFTRDCPNVCIDRLADGLTRCLARSCPYAMGNEREGRQRSPTCSEVVRWATDEQDSTPSRLEVAARLTTSARGIRVSSRVRDELGPETLSGKQLRQWDDTKHQPDCSTDWSERRRHSVLRGRILCFPVAFPAYKIASSLASGSRGTSKDTLCTRSVSLHGPIFTSITDRHPANTYDRNGLDELCGRHCNIWLFSAQGDCRGLRRLPWFDSTTDLLALCGLSPKVGSALLRPRRFCPSSLDLRFRGGRPASACVRGRRQARGSDKLGT